MYYIRNWSIWTDIQIILQTIPAVLSRRGAY
jgi:lipopolysaccharide/colanic/teichoic acid biosynthesis glycosyltransferase